MQTCEDEQIRDMEEEMPEEAGPCKTWTIPRVRDFESLLRERFFPDILAQMNEYLCRGDLSAALETPVVSRHISPAACRLTSCDCYRLNRTDFLADLLLRVELTLQEKGRDVTENRAFCLTLWFSTGEEGFTFETEGICRAENRPERSLIPLDRHLVPRLHREEVENEAERMLEAWLPGVPPEGRTAEKLAAALGLQLRSLRLHGRKGVRAMLLFRDAEVAVQPEMAPGEEEVPPPRPVRVEANTVILNTAERHWDGLPLDIFHECIHAEWHLLFYRLQKLLTTCDGDVPVRRVQNSTGKRPADPLHWMEQHARQGALALLLPRRTTLETARRRFQAASADPSPGQYYNHAGFRWKKVIEGIQADLSNAGEIVALAVVRRRLVSLGFLSARGAVNYVDGRYITPFAFTAEYSEKGRETFVICRREMMELYRRSRPFREQMSRGDFAFVDGHVCLNDAEYVRKTRKGTRLTAWANAHVDVCCLPFDREYIRDRESILLFGALESSEEYNRAYNRYLDRRMTRTAEQRAARRNELMRGMPNNFSDALRYVMENRDGGRVTVEELAADAQVSTRTIERYRRADQPAYQEDKLIALCIALHLPPWLSRALLGKARVIVTSHGPRGYVGEILDCCFMDTVDEVQTYLEENGYPRLRLQDD